MSDPLIVRAARREPVERTPVWFMRQAGRSLPEYRAIRARHAFFEVAHTPELCAEVTLQPVRRHDVDAAVMFADIMTPVLGMGLDVQLVEGVGPVVERPVRTLADVEALRVPDPEEAFAPVLEAVRLVRAELPAEKGVIGFCGGPFTVAGYLVEGRPSRELSRTKALMLAEPAVWDALMERLAETFAAYVRRQGRRGRRRHPAVRLVGRGALPVPLSRPGGAVERAHPRGRRRADDPLRHGQPRPCRP